MNNLQQCYENHINTQTLSLYLKRLNSFIFIGLGTMVALFIITGGAQAAEQATSHGMLIGFFLYPHTPTLLALFLFAWALYLILNY